MIKDALECVKEMAQPAGFEILNENGRPILQVSAFTKLVLPRWGTDPKSPF